MSTNTSASLFPLRLTPFEEFMFVDDRPDYPMTFFLDIGLSGALCRPSLEKALQEALARHPLLTSRVALRWTRAYWNDSQLTPEIQWSAGEPRVPPPAGTIPGSAPDFGPADLGWSR